MKDWKDSNRTRRLDYNRIKVQKVRIDKLNKSFK